MRKTTLAFLGLVFVVYWLWTMDSQVFERQAALNPVIPSFIRALPFTKKREPNGNREEKPAASKYDQSGMRHWLSEEAVRVGRVDANPSSTVLRLKKKALSLVPQQLDLLKTVALDRSNPGDERFLAVYMIGLAESAAAREDLKEIGQSPIPATSNDRSYSDEVVIRAHAMEGAIKHMSPADSVKFLQDILSSTQDPSLTRHARYWLSRLG